MVLTPLPRQEVYTNAHNHGVLNQLAYIYQLTSANIEPVLPLPLPLLPTAGRPMHARRPPGDATT